MEMGLSESVVAVFGAARGIGAAIARAFAEESARVVAIDRDEAVVEMAAGLPGPIPSPPIVIDVTDDEAVRGAAGTIGAAFGRCDHLVFAVGAGSGKFGFPFWKLEPGDWDRVIRVNLIGAVNVAHAFAPTMAESADATPSGRSMLLLSSVAGQIGSQTDPPYSAAKAAVINFAQCAAKDLAPHGVRVNALCPGMVKTPLNRSVYEAWAREQEQAGAVVPSYEEWTADKIRKLVPMNRWQEPEDIAAMAVFLASARGRNVAGQTINVDGGYVMHW